MCVYNINSFAFVFFSKLFSLIMIMKISKLQYLIPLEKIEISVSPLHFDI